VREKFSVAYRKYQLDNVQPTWFCYDSCTFLEPFVNLKPDMKKEEPELLPVLIERNPPKSPFDENMLTQLVKERPVLFDKQHEDFRAANMRKKAWIEIANISGWDVRSLQKRWRVMRDRFVRELRRTKNIDGDSQISCSAFFRDMLFLVRHVKSKKYEAEATDVSSDISQDNWDVSGESESVQQVETCVIPETEATGEESQHLMEETTDGSGQVVTYSIDEGHQQQYVECFEGREETEVYDESSNDVPAEDYYEEEEQVLEKTIEDEQHLIPQTEDVVAVQEISQNQWYDAFNANVTSDNPVKKRKISFEIREETPVKRRSESPAPSTSGHSRHRMSDSMEVTSDEDIAFGQTIGLMLKKVPPHLKTFMKLKIFESIAKFEAEHKLYMS
jgi:Alcohol dehydrogenase transcription factor Myb/SANT-like